MTVAITIILITSTLLLFVSMVFSAMASTAAARITSDPGSVKDNADSAHRNSMIAAVICGISALLGIVTVILYLNSDRIVSSAHDALGRRVAAMANAGSPAAVAAVQAAGVGGV